MIALWCIIASATLGMVGVFGGWWPPIWAAVFIDVGFMALVLHNSYGWLATGPLIAATAAVALKAVWSYRKRPKHAVWVLQDSAMHKVEPQGTGKHTRTEYIDPSKLVVKK